jgi:protoporphyrinogen oxidase
MQKKKVVMLGGGFSGLWIATQLLERGYDVEVLEKEKEVGGLLQSVKLEEFNLDLGPHIYFPSHKHYYEQFLEEPLQQVMAFYGFSFRNRQVRSPITPHNLYKSLPFKDTFLMGLSFLLSQLHLFSSTKNVDSAEDWAVSQYGRVAYRNFFQDYIPKVTGLSADRVSSDWGTDRVRFYKEHNLLQKSFRFARQWSQGSDKQNNPLKLYYAPTGAQQITEGLSRFITEKSGTVRTGATVKKIILDQYLGIKNVVFVQNGQEQKVHGNYYVSTVPVTELIKMMHTAPSTALEAARALKFRHLLCCFYVIRRHHLTDKMQIYFPEKKYLFKRVYEDPSVRIVPTERTAVCAEVCYSPGDSVSQIGGKEMDPLVREQLCSFYQVRPDEFVVSLFRKAPFAYAVYEKGYREHLKQIAAFLYGIDSLISFGRSGLFRYDFLTDRIIDAAQTVLRYIESSQRKSEFLKEPDPKGDFL